MAVKCRAHVGGCERPPSGRSRPLLWRRDGEQPPGALRRPVGGDFCRGRLRAAPLRGDSVGLLVAALSVSDEGEAVDAEGVGDEVEVLALVADAVGSAEPEGVVEVAVDGFGVVASFVERGEVRIGCGDGSDVLGAVEPASGVFVGAVEPDGDGAFAEAWREAVVVVPAVAAVLVGVRWVRTRASSVKWWSPVSVRVVMPIAPSRAKRSTVMVEPSGRVTVRCSTKVDLATRWPSLRRGFFDPALAAATLLTGSSPRWRRRCWWCVPRSAVS